MCLEHVHHVIRDLIQVHVMAGISSGHNEVKRDSLVLLLLVLIYLIVKTLMIVVSQSNDFGARSKAREVCLDR